ncbi:Hypothetical predicted protein, partial [Mytilus galloprovincialis]
KTSFVCRSIYFDNYICYFVRKNFQRENTRNYGKRCNNIRVRSSLIHAMLLLGG